MAADRFELETRLVVEQFELKSDNRIRLLARLVEKLEKMGSYHENDASLAGPLIFLAFSSNSHLLSTFGGYRHLSRFETQLNRLQVVLRLKIV